jgi:hypothetical protein
MNSLSKSATCLCLSLLTLLVFQVINAQSRRNAHFEERERVILKKSNFNPPLTIENVKVKGRSVPLAKKFVDDEDWLNGLGVTVRNNSAKTVTYVDIKMVFDRLGAPDDGPADVAWSLDYGTAPNFYETAADVPTSPVNIPPGGELEIKLGESEFADLRNFLTKVNYPSKLHIVELRVYSIGFLDGTMWSGKMIERGAGRGEWKPIQNQLFSHPSQQSRRSNSFFLQINTQ